MRYASVQTQFWRSQDVQSLSELARHTYLYLLTSPHSNMAGYYYMPLGYAAEDMQRETGEIRKAVAELTERELIAYDQTAKVVLIKKYLAHNPINGPKQAQGVVAAVGTVPKSPLLAEFVALAKQYNPENSEVWDTLSIPLRYPIDTLSHTLSDTPSIPVISNQSSVIQEEEEEAPTPETDQPTPAPSRVEVRALLWHQHAEKVTGHLSTYDYERVEKIRLKHNLGHDLLIALFDWALVAATKSPYGLMVSEGSKLGATGIRSLDGWERYKEAKAAKEQERQIGRGAARGGQPARQSNVIIKGPPKPEGYYDHINNPPWMRSGGGDPGPDPPPDDGRESA